jgi:hypothetical protein
MLYFDNMPASSLLFMHCIIIMIHHLLDYIIIDMGRGMMNSQTQRCKSLRWRSWLATEYTGPSPPFIRSHVMRKSTKRKNAACEPDTSKSQN